MNKGISTKFNIVQRAFEIASHSIADKYYKNGDDTDITTKIEFLEKYSCDRYGWQFTVTSKKYEYSVIVDCYKKYVSEYVARTISLITTTFEQLIKSKINELYVSNTAKEIGHNS